MNSPVLLYHKIDRPTADTKIRGAFTSPAVFERQLRYLQRHHCRFYLASEFIRHFKENGTFPEKGVCLTFDDGWKDNFVHAFPLIRAFNAKATIYIVPSCIGQTSDRVAPEGEGPREHLSEGDIREMSAAGIEFGSHSMNHLLFDRVEPQSVVYEITNSKAYIENLLQKECSTIAYPAGFYTAQAREEIRRAGYEAAFSTVYGPEDNSDLFAMNRTEVLRRDRYPFQFGRKIRSIFQT